MKNQTVIKRYARALLELGKADGKFATYGDELKRLADALAQTGDDFKSLTSPAFPEGVRRKMLNAILAKAELSPLVDNFIRLLMDKDRLTELIGIAEIYNQLADDLKGVSQATIISAKALSQPELEAVAASLNKFAGRKVELSVTEDESIIGGIIAQLGDLTIDGSVRTQLNKLSEILDTL